MKKYWQKLYDGMKTHNDLNENTPERLFSDLSTMQLDLLHQSRSGIYHILHLVDPDMNTEGG